MISNNCLAAEVLISEVGPRDGLQSIKTIMPTPEKLGWVDALYAAGLREIEVGSFVSPKLLPQMADTAAVVRHAATLDGLNVTVLVPNFRGAQDALEAGAHTLSVPVSASERHSVSNVRKTPTEMIEVVRSIATLRSEIAPSVKLEVGISTAFGCTLQGQVNERDVIALAAACAKAGADEIGLSDTVGYADPSRIRSLFRLLRAEVGEHIGAAHLHNTRGLGLANCLAALDEGVRKFDSSLAGLGGCPYAPGASGNVVTEDLVFMFEAMGISTGVDMARLIEARGALRAALPGEWLYGHLADAGLPKGFGAEAGI